MLFDFSERLGVCYIVHDYNSVRSLEEIFANVSVGVFPGRVPNIESVLSRLAVWQSCFDCFSKVRCDRCCRNIFFECVLGVLLDDGCLAGVVTTNKENFLVIGGRYFLFFLHHHLFFHLLAVLNYDLVLLSGFLFRSQASHFC